MKLPGYYGEPASCCWFNGDFQFTQNGSDMIQICEQNCNCPR